MDGYTWDNRLAAWVTDTGRDPACPDCGTTLTGGRQCACGHTWTVTALHQAGQTPRTIVRQVPDQDVLMRVASTRVDTTTVLL